ncbi:MAG: hypothetical protein ACHQHN_19750 [Sphingobacteriales bacterium]|jgi:hypothetical protein
MKRNIVVIILAAMVVILDIKFIVNILLNKKYVVDELSDVKSLTPLKSMEEIIQNDYLYGYYILIANTILIIGISILIIVTPKSGRLDVQK